jgi:hypothetical protein
MARYVALLVAALIVVCWLKGEPPRWRWATGAFRTTDAPEPPERMTEGRKP